MVRRYASLALLTICWGCRIWSSGESKLEQRADLKPSARAHRDDWDEGRLPDTPASESPQQGGEIVVRIHSEPPSLNTLLDSDAVAARITEHRIYESLLSLDPYDHPRYRLQPELAERWQVSSDGLTYTFWLRRSVKWHDGLPFTARDVIATFEKVQDPNTKAMHVRSYTQDLESFRALDDYAVEFRFKRPYFLVMDGIFADVPIQPAHLIAHLSGAQYNDAASNPLNRHPIGTGPFRFEAWETNHRIALARNREYWRRPPYLDRVVFRIIKESSVILELAARQELDVVTRIRPEQWVRMDRQLLAPHFHRALYYGSNYLWVGYNQARSLFRDARVRRAMTMLIDRNGIINGLLYGLARPTTCHFYVDSSACDASLEPPAYDPAQASSLLEQAGWHLSSQDRVRTRSGQRFVFTLMIPAAAEDSIRMATLAKESMARAGVEMRLQKVEWSAFVKRLRERDFDACTLLWGSSSPRKDPMQVWHSSSIQGGSNYVGFSSERADRLIEVARTEFDEERRNALYRELGRILYDEQPYTWLLTRPELTLVHRRIRGARVSLADFRYEDFWVMSESTEAAR
ncbi:MAG TPA: peptide-binding protein [Polyangiaceae bacterium]|nr:peptide-binding protein [Polyangiaceae bacterium]